MQLGYLSVATCTILMLAMILVVCPTRGKACVGLLVAAAPAIPMAAHGSQDFWGLVGAIATIAALALLGLPATRMPGLAKRCAGFKIRITAGAVLATVAVSVALFAYSSKRPEDGRAASPPARVRR